MLPITVAQKDTLAKSSVLQAHGRLIANFNFNRFINVTSVTNPLSTADDNPYFPIASVIDRARPEAGIVKAMVGGSGGFPTIGKVGGVLSASDKDLWSYTTSVEDKYKYFRSPAFSTGALYLGAAGHYTLPQAQVQVLYETSEDANKIIVGFENTYISPKHVTVEHRVGSTWFPQAIANPTLNSAGQLVLYRQADNTWGTTVYRNNPVENVNGVRVTVNAISHQNANVYIIEVAAAREVDVTDDIYEVTADDTVSEHSLILPIGDISSNEASVTLDNTSRLYSSNNTSSPYHKFMGKWAEFNFEFNIHSPGAAAQAGDWKQFFRRYCEFPEPGENKMTFRLKDSAMVLQEAKPNAVTLSNVSVTAVAVYLCHSVGFRRVGYTIQDIDPKDTHARLKHYWVDPEKTVWELLQELSEATQTAFYFDETDTLQIKTRAAAFDLAAEPVWIFDSEDIDAAAVTAQGRLAGDVGKVADLISFPEEEQFGPNTVEVKHIPTEPSKVTRGIPAMAVAWEPEETITLRSSNLVADIPLNTSTEHSVRLSSADAAIWPYSGLLQVNSEIIKYDGKQYSYYLANGTTALKYIESAEEKAALDALNEGFAWRNVFTGYLRVKVGGRGYKNTVPGTHTRAGRTYTCRLRTGTGSMVNGAKYVTKNLSEGYMRLNPLAYKPQSLTRLVARTTAPVATAPRLYGTQLKFPASGYVSGVAGMLIGAGTNDSGFYIELVRTAAIGTRPRNELNFTWKNSAGTETLLSKGTQIAIAADVPYQMDVALTSDASNWYFTVYIDGAPRANFSATKASTQSLMPTDFGVFTRTHTICDFYYLYAYGGHTEDTGGFDKASYLDLLKGGYRSATYRQIQTLPSTRGSRLSPNTLSWKRQAINSIVIDEFGAVAHEVRDFDIKYDEFPALHSMLYISNSSQVACSDFVPGPTSAKFTLVNVSRKTAVINGEDTLSYGPDNSVDQKLMVYGRMIVREEPKSKTVRNEQSIVRRGLSELTVESDWIQTEEQAARIADWIIGTSVTAEGDLEAFANPYIQLLDLVAIQDPENYRTWTTHRYFVMGRSMRFDGTLSVDFTLRRAV